MTGFAQRNATASCLRVATPLPCVAPPRAAEVRHTVLNHFVRSEALLRTARSASRRTVGVSMFLSGSAALSGPFSKTDEQPESGACAEEVVSERRGGRGRAPRRR